MVAVFSAAVFAAVASVDLLSVATGDAAGFFAASVEAADFFAASLTVPVVLSVAAVTGLCLSVAGVAEGFLSAAGVVAPAAAVGAAFFVLEEALPLSAGNNAGEAAVVPPAALRRLFSVAVLPDLPVAVAGALFLTAAGRLVAGRKGVTSRTDLRGCTVIAWLSPSSGGLTISACGEAT